MIKRPLLSIALALSATLAMAIGASANTTYVEWIHGSELPNATTTEGQFVGEATGSFAGGWYIDVKHQPLNGSSVSITGGSFRLDTFINNWPAAIRGTFVPYQGTVTQLSGWSGCTNQRFGVSGKLSNVGVGGGTGSGAFRATLTHYRANIWWVGCVVYAASVSGTVSLDF